MNGISADEFKRMSIWALLFVGQTPVVKLPDGRKFNCRLINLDELEEYESQGWGIEACEAAGKVFPMAFREV
jgi:hypothetical protein